MNLVEEFKNSSTLVKVLAIAIVVLIFASLACGCVLLLRVFFASPAPPPPTVPISFVTPTPGGEATPASTPVVVSGWRGEYFSNPDVQGEPTVIRDDERIDFDWGNGSPASDVPADNFSVRWTRTVEEVPAGTYRLNGRFDNRVRIWIDDVLVVDQWRESPVRTVNVDVNVAAGVHVLKVEYGHLTGSAVAQLSAQYIENYPDWKAEYFNNPALAEAPVAVRNEVEINYNWGATSPIPGVVPDNNYSVRWSRQAHFDGGNYLFRVLVEGGARVWFDGQMLIDTWDQGAFREATAPIGPIDRGNHSLRVEYWKETGNGQISVSWAEQQEPDEAPLAVINGTTKAQVGQQVNFSARNSSVAEGSHLTAFNWEFGDGTTASGVNVSHVYNAAAVYDVKLTVVDDKGRSDTTTHRTEITEAPVTPVPGPVAVINAPSKAEVGDVVTFDGSSSTCTESCVRYDWDLGDGNKANAIKLQHTYHSPGIYNVTLTVTDSKNQSNSTVKQIEIRSASPGPTPTPGPTNTPEPGAPVAVINAPGEANAGDPVSFDGSASTDSNGANCVQANNCSYSWDMGDGNTYNQVSFQHTYDVSSDTTFNVILKVSDLTTQKSSETSHAILIRSAATPTTEPTVEPTTEPTTEPTAEPTAEPTTEPQPDPPTAVIASNLPDTSNVPVGTTGVFNCTSSTPGAEATIDECTWTFSDDGSTQTGVEVSHDFNTEGPVTVELTVRQTPGDATGSTSLPVTVSP